MRLFYLEEDGIQPFDETRVQNPEMYEWGSGKLFKNPMTITLHVEIDKDEYLALKRYYKRSLRYRIISYFGIK